MTILVFILMNYFTSSWASSGPNMDGTLGFTGWMQYHRHGYYGVNWLTCHFNFFALVGEILIAIALTWLLALVLDLFKYKKIV